MSNQSRSRFQYIYGRSSVREGRCEASVILEVERSAGIVAALSGKRILLIIVVSASV